MPPSRHIITASRDGQVRVWDSATGKVVRQFGHETERTVNAAFVPGHENLLVTAGMEDGTARLWDFDKGQEIRRFLHGGVVDTLKTMFPKGGVRSTAFLPDQKTLITGGNDGTVRFWNLDDGKELYRLEIGQYIQDLLLAPKGDFIVVSAEDETSVWTLPARQKVSSLSMSAEGDQFASALCLNADGSLLFEGGNRSRPSVRVRSLPDLKKVAELLHEHSIFSAALTQDQTRLVTGSQDNRVRVWDTQTWQMTAQFETQDIVYEVALINKDQSIIAASSDGFIRIWPFSTALLLRNARGKLHRDLTQEEWHQYFGDLPYNFTRASKN